MHKKKSIRFLSLRTAVCILCSFVLLSAHLLEGSNTGARGWWPQEYSVSRDDTRGVLVLKTRYYTVEHELKRGGVISRIHYTHGRADNIILKPMETTVQLEDKRINAPYSGPGSLPIFSDLNDSSPQVVVRKSGKSALVMVQSRLLDDEGRDSGIVVITTYSYRWGYIKVHKEVCFPEEGMRIKNLGILETVLHPSLYEYGYRNGVHERVFANLWSWRSEIIQWRKLRVGTHFDKFLQTRHLPRYLVFANPGVEGLEWFMSDELWQWDYQMTGIPGTSFCHIFSSRKPLGIVLSIYPVNLYKGAVEVSGTRSFDYYIGMPILEGHAYNPWLNKRVHANGGKWVSEEEIREWAESGVNVVVLHNDGPTPDGLFWRDGSYPPYPPQEMKKMDRIISLCHKYGIKIVPYFSNHELFPTVEAYKEHGREWMRIVDDTGTNINWRYGYYMCLKSGWLDFFKFSVDRVLKNHDFDGVYYDWNLALYCNNPLHVGKTSNGVPRRELGSLALSPTGHWDMDELIELVEWTRQRAGKEGLVLIHNTLVPMFATENFANYVVGMEFGYSRVSESFPPLDELPLEWNFAGARSRAAIVYGLIDPDAPRRLHRQMALAGILTGVAPWRATPEALTLFRLLRPLGDLEQYRFLDWRNKAVCLDCEDCESAVYSREGESYVILGNFCSEPKGVNCILGPEKLPFPLLSIREAEILSEKGVKRLDAGKLTTSGEKILIPAEGAVVLHIKQ
ncbi:MAG: hypothetical protein ACE5LC_06965 [Candidatus Aminicenantales bacterium]